MLGLRAHRVAILVSVGALAVTLSSNAIAGGGGPVSCDTFDPCKVGICLEDGTCEASPGNDGSACHTFNECTTGECSDGECVETPANEKGACSPGDLCMEEVGECSQGECVGTPIDEGESCRQDLLGPCLVGVCQNFGPSRICIPAPKCSEGENNACVFSCNFLTGECESVPTRICDTDCTTATCVPGKDFEYECTDPEDKPDDTPCTDLNTCNGNEDTCQNGHCVGAGEAQVCGNGDLEAPEECDDGDTHFEDGEACSPNCTFIACGKPTNSEGELPKASDALFALKAAVSSATCELAVCDVNDNGEVGASDALLMLKAAVGSDVDLDCPAAA